MKISRDDLKAIVKECLIEILANGIGQEAITEARSTPKKVMQEQKKVVSPRQHQQNLVSQDDIKIVSAGSKVMEGIFADTAKTTYPKMLYGEANVGKQGMTVIDQIVAEHEPEELFGQEVSSKWAELAFAPPKLPK